MNKRKLSLSIIIFIAISILFTGCSKNESSDLGLKPDQMGYMLTSKNGFITAFDISGKALNETKIGNSSSDYIYIQDEGNIYSSELEDGDKLPQVLYAIDKNKSIVSILKVTNEEVELVDEVGIRDGHKIDKVKAYNGKLYYSIIDSGLNAKKHTFKKSQEYLDSSIVDYNAKEPARNNVKTYIISEDLSDLYYDIRLGEKDSVKEETKENKEKLDEKDEEILETTEKETDNQEKIITEKTNIVEIPYILDDWNVNEDTIFFFFENFMGQYNLEDDSIGLYYGAKNTVKTRYIDGINKKVLTLNGLGEEASKSVLFELEPNFMQVRKSIEVDEGIPLDMFVQKDKYIYTVFKNMSEDAKTRARVNVFNYNDYELKGVLPVEYVPTKIVGKNGLVFLFNPYEDHLLFGNLEDQELRKYQTKFDNVEYDDLFIFDFEYKDDYMYNDRKEKVNKKGDIINEDGFVLAEDGTTLNNLGQIVNEFGEVINDKGEKIDRYNNVIDDNGEIIKYVKGEDGYYRNGFGNPVNEKGENLIRNKDGEWVEKEVKKDSDNKEIPGYYDEKGDFHVSPEYLRNNPDAYSDLLKQEGKTIDTIKEEENKESDKENLGEKEDLTDEDITEKEETIETEEGLIKKEAEETSFLDKIKAFFKKDKKQESDLERKEEAIKEEPVKEKNE